MNTLEIRNLNISCGQNRLAKEVNLSLKMDKITGLIGKSGSGKSLTSLEILGFLPSNLHGSCEILVGEKPLVRRDGFFANIMQNPRTAFNPLNSIESHAKETIRARNLRDRLENSSGKSSTNLSEQDEIKWAFEGAGLSTDTLGLYPSQMSGGMLQRAMIALTLLTRPKFIIADEPTTDLDLLSQKRVLKMLSNLALKSGVGMLIITHDFGVIKHICDEVFVMEDGVIIEHGEVRKVFENPQSKGAKAIIGAYNFLNKSSEVQIGESPEPSELCSKKSNEIPALEISNLNFSYKIFSLLKNSQKSILGDLNFTLKSGKALGILGVSGSGKSTLAQILMQIYAPNSGEVSLFGQTLNAKTLKQRREIYRQIQIVFQDPLSSVNPRNSVLECIEEPLNYLFKLDKNERTRRIREALDLVGLSEDFLPKLALNLSGGQIQRVLIARALAVHPKVLILDESLSSLDTILQMNFIKLLRNLKSHLTLIFITHDIRLARILCDEIILIDDGRIVETILPHAKMQSQIGQNFENAVLK